MFLKICFPYLLLNSFFHLNFHRLAGDRAAMVLKPHRAPLGVPVPLDVQKNILAFQTSLDFYFFPKEELAENPVRSGVDVSSKLPK